MIVFTHARKIKYTIVNIRYSKAYSSQLEYAFEFRILRLRDLSTFIYKMPDEQWHISVNSNRATCPVSRAGYAMPGDTGALMWTWHNYWSARCWLAITYYITVLLLLGICFVMRWFLCQFTTWEVKYEINIRVKLSDARAITKDYHAIRLMIKHLLWTVIKYVLLHKIKYTHAWPCSQTHN